MVNGTQGFYKVMALAAAIFVTAGLQGTMLAGFNQVAADAQLAALTQCTASTPTTPAL
jgi:hypothetical protein